MVHNNQRRCQTLKDGSKQQCSPKQEPQHCQVQPAIRQDWPTSFLSLSKLHASMQESSVDHGSLLFDKLSGLLKHSQLLFPLLNLDFGQLPKEFKLKIFTQNLYDSNMKI